jgi:hypothetical protein
MASKKAAKKVKKTNVAKGTRREEKREAPQAGEASPAGRLDGEEGEGYQEISPGKFTLSESERRALAKKLFADKVNIEGELEALKAEISKCEDKLSDLAKEVVTNLGTGKFSYNGETFTANRHRTAAGQAPRYHFRTQSEKVFQVD